MKNTTLFISLQKFKGNKVQLKKVPVKAKERENTMPILRDV